MDVLPLQDFVHPHPLTLFNEDNGNSRGEKCWACRKPISGPSLRCKTCDGFSLHQSCGELELPQEMTHFWHPDHPLILRVEPFPRLPGHIDSLLAVGKRFPKLDCYACDKSISGGLPMYTCVLCHFCLDVGCASLAQSIEHPSLHQHPLTLLLKLSVFCCDACGITHEEPGLPYHCASCNFWVHQDCASLSGTNLEHTSHHQHPLTLVSSCKKSEIYKFPIYCDICKEEVRGKNCIYYCADCTYFAHVHCATSILPPDKSHEGSGAEDHPSSSTQISCLSMPDESSSIDLVNSLLEKISLLGASKVGRGLKGRRCESCDHNSILIDAETNEVCDACVRPISTPYYNCSECHLILHKSCAELPSEIQHPFHTRHPLFLQQTPFVRCGACGRFYTGFSYGCRRCNFDLDIKCASLPTTIRHEAHEYPLNLVDEGCDERCSSCHELCRNYKFRCRDCKFSVHIQCSSLPQTHDGRGYDDHALILKYSPVGIKREEYYCEICEEEMDTKLWFYYCADCNQAFHGKCLYTAADDFANIKLGAIINVKNHPHHLTIQRAKLNGLNCDACRLPCKNLLCECKECGFNLHFHCALDRQTPNERWRNTLVVEAAMNRFLYPCRLQASG